MIEFGHEICANLNEATTREWLETNGIGGYASSTIAGINTRRYHGLLVAATTPPTGRAVLLSKLEEAVSVDGTIYELSANQYPKTIYPNGYSFLKSFRLNPFPIWQFEIAGEFGIIEIEKSVFMVDNENTVVVEYKFNSTSDIQNLKLELRPLVAFRDYHHLRHVEDDFQKTFQTTGNSVSIKPIADLPALNFSFKDAEIEQTGFWYRNFEYERERERGFDFEENLFQPFVIKFDVSETLTISLVASTETIQTASVKDLRREIIARRVAMIENAGFGDKFLQQLSAASDQFIVSREAEKSVIAGYHWFADWGRDTMIALPGLTLTTNRTKIAKSILLEFSKHISQGMLPNRFPDQGQTPEYNTVDATLWYFEAVRAYLAKTDDYDFVEQDLYEKLIEIIVWHLRGTRYNIHVDTDGLLCAGDENTQLTWMDAKSGETTFTPRSGKAVEIQALWYNALRVMQDLARRFGDNGGNLQYAAMADLAQISFTQTFWNEEEECLFDCVNGTRDGAVRPNQVFAVSLTYSMLPLEKAQKVLRKIEAELLTPVGLRTLSPKDVNYQGVYEGNGFERDRAYHQGTVWAWLSGAFITAYAKTFADEPNTKAHLEKWLEPFKFHLSEAGLGSISEIFDGDAPHTPRGCVAQAWSVAEILRAAVEDVY
ncbi:MAG: amylo-alpha-1,6-glucosidase [Pyrinomonadaceae bacterium]